MILVRRPDDSGLTFDDTVDLLGERLGITIKR
jgi:hypothetical protein